MRRIHEVWKKKEQYTSEKGVGCKRKIRRLTRKENGNGKRKKGTTYMEAKSFLHLPPINAATVNTRKN